MLDDMAIQLNQEKSDHKEALSDLKLQHEKEVRRHFISFFQFDAFSFVLLIFSDLFFCFSFCVFSGF